MIAFKQLTIHFDSTKGKKQRESKTAIFDRPVNVAEVTLKGFKVKYTDGDKHLYAQEIDLDIEQINRNSVRVGADFLLRDSSGNIDDRFEGWIQCIVIADLR